MIPPRISAPSVPRRPVSEYGRPGFCAICRKARASVAGIARRMIRSRTREQAKEQAQSAALNLALLLHMKAELLAEKERLCAARKTAVRMHRPVTSLDNRLRAINADLLRIG